MTRPPGPAAPVLPGTPHAGAAAEAPPPVSVIVPAGSAEATLADALDAILAQDYAGPVEIVVADGSDTPAVGELLRRRFPGVRVARNPEQTIPCALNHALRAARHGIVARCDARAAFPPGYLARAVAALGRTGAVNVGGRIHAVGVSFFERAVALTTSTPLGAGDARYRIGGAEGPVDTVYPGVFRREAVEAAGGWDETLLANEDYELNWRLRERGGTVWFDPALTVHYRPLGSLGAVARQYFRYGRWKRAMLRRHPRSLRARQLAPPLLLAALAASAVLGAVAAFGAPAALAPALAAAAAAVPAAYPGAAARVQPPRSPSAAAAPKRCWRRSSPPPSISAGQRDSAWVHRPPRREPGAPGPAGPAGSGG